MIALLFGLLAKIQGFGLLDYIVSLLLSEIFKNLFDQL